MAAICEVSAVELGREKVLGERERERNRTSEGERTHGVRKVRNVLFN